MSDKSEAIESRDDFKSKYEYWDTEVRAALKRLKPWHKQVDQINERFLDKKKAQGGSEVRDGFSLNLYHSNIATLEALMYGNLPKADVSRRFTDQNDDIARVAGEMLERLLNSDISQNPEQYDSSLRSSLQDRLLGGLGCGRVRYLADFDDDENLIDEDAPIEYFYWRDVIWGWCRNYAEMPWMGFRSYLTKDQVGKRFGEEVAKQLEYKKQTPVHEETSDTEEEVSVWSKAEVWEIWEKDTKKVVYISLGYKNVIEEKKDPLKLSGFFPAPPFFIANATTSLYQPTSDYHLHQDLYNEIDTLQTRISIITEAVKVIGVYDRSAEGVQRMFKDGNNTELIPVDNWAMFAEKGGLKGVIEWFPLADVVNALKELILLRDDTIALLQQVTGMSDIMQGGLKNQYEGVGQSQIKAKFGSVRVQKMQDDFAAFVSSLLQIKAEIICKHFDPETIVARSNMLTSPDRDLIPQAVQLLKSGRAKMRVIVRPESVAMTDFAQLRSERTEYLTAISTFMQSASGLIENDPDAKPFLLQLLQWGLAGFKGSSEIEGVVDKAIEAATNKAKEDKPDPKRQEMEMAMTIERAKVQGQLSVIRAKSQADLQLRQLDSQSDIQASITEHQGKMQEIQANHEAAMAEIFAKAKMTLENEILSSEADAEQQALRTAGEMEKNIQEHNMRLTETVVESQAKMAEKEMDREIQNESEQSENS